MVELPATFGKYFLTEKLATGGMAEIYLGKLIGPGGFEKQLVIKQIHPRLAADRHFVDLFVAEAKTLVNLTHGNIVPVYELGIVDDTYFIAMEYIDGPTLWRLTEATWAAGEPVAPALAAYVAAEILDGLDYAHRKGEGVIHRDLSPRNVMLSRDGQVLLVDFGIAVPFGAGDDPDADGAPTGSFPYMSPEQVERRRLTTASDLFSAGVLLWEMLAGRRLFARDTGDATLEAVRSAPIAAPSSLRPEVPRRLDEVVLRALERDPARRWPGAAEFLAALNKYLYSLEVTPTSRDLAALIARHCPPVVAQAEPAAVETAADAGDEATQARGPGTVVVPRRSGEPPVETAVREKSFATHVEIERVLGATPLFPLRAIREEDEQTQTATAAAATEATATAAATAAATEAAAEAAAEAEAAADAAAEAETVPAAGPLAARWLPYAAITTALAAVLAWLLLRPDAAPAGSDAPADAATVAVPAADAATVAVPAADAANVAAPAADAATVAAPAADAAVAVSRRPDAGARVARDAGPPPPPRDAGAAVAAKGTIKVGANPWGEVFIDGQKRGHAPGQWDVRAGPHDVVVVFPGPEGEQKKRYRVDVIAGEIASVFADFQ